jgi:hypothetical protein
VAFWHAVPSVTMQVVHVTLALQIFPFCPCKQNPDWHSAPLVHGPLPLAIFVAQWFVASQ